ncbi:MAG: EamA family transporter, partial [Casimicrobiaceae bacterium]
MTAFPSARDFALLLLVVALLGFSFVPIKLGLREIPPFALAGLRFLFAAVPLVFFVRPPRMPIGLIVAYGFAIGVVQFGLLFFGMKLGMPAGLSSLVIQLQVFFTIGLAIALLGDRLHA